MNPDLSRQIANLIRLGSIAEIDYQAALVRVKIGDADNQLLTNWMPWQTRAGHINQWAPPTIGEACIVLCPGGESDFGVVLTGLFTDTQPPSSQDQDTYKVTFIDGAAIQYSTKTGALAASGLKTASIAASGTVTVDAPKISCTNDLDIGGNLSVKGLSEFSKDVAIRANLSALNGAFSGAVGAASFAGPPGASGASPAKFNVPINAPRLEVDSLKIGGVEAGGHTHADPQGGVVGPMQ